MKLLFTGASGFLGNNVHPLLEAIYEVTTVGLLPQDDYTVNMAQEIPELRENGMISFFMQLEKHM